MARGRIVIRLGLSVLTLGSFQLLATEAQICASCHPKETAAYLKSPMSASVQQPSQLAASHIQHKPSGSEISITYRDGRMIHALTSNGLTAEYPVASEIGAGTVGHTYLVRI